MSLPPGKREAQEIKLSASEERQILDAAKRRKKRGKDVGEIIALLDRQEDPPEVHGIPFPLYMLEPSESAPPLDGLDDLQFLEEYLSQGSSLLTFGSQLDTFGESQGSELLGFCEGSEE